MDKLATDPLQNYSKTELIALIERQAFENEDLRTNSEKFEHLYLDIIHSTSWKLSWPIRFAFKILTTMKKGFQKSSTGRSTAVAQAAAGQSGNDAHASQEVSFDNRLSDLKYFTNDHERPRINVLVSQRLETDQFQDLLGAVAAIADHAQLALRVLSFDPQVTARICQDTLSRMDRAQSLEFVFHAVSQPTLATNKFRLDFGRCELMLVFSEPAFNLASTIAPKQNCLLIDPADSAWQKTAEARAAQIVQTATVRTALEGSR